MLAATLFAGIGAPEAACPHWDWRWCAEIDKFACAVLNQRHPASVNLGDVTAHDFAERAAAVARPDVLVFGSPCQSFSVAGQRLGLDDPRGNLALVALGIVDRLKPRWFVFENVPGLLSSDQGRDFGIFLRTVDELGYRCAWSVLDAQYFGVAQRRERVFVVGHLGDWRRAAAVLLEPEGVRGHHPPRREKGQRPAPTIAARTSAGGGLGTDFDCDGGLIASHDVAPTLRAMNEIDGNANAGGQVAVAWGIIGGAQEGKNHAYRQEVSGCLQHKGLAATGNEAGTLIQQPVAVALRGREGGATAEVSDIPSALRASQGGGDKAHVMAFTLHGADKTVNTATRTELAGSIRTKPPGSIENSSTTAVLQASLVRRLTPKECERLQGFPDGYTAVPYRGKPAADGPRYRALGNAMAVPVVRWILERIEKLDGGA